MSNRGRGRPVGFKLSNDSKNKIRVSRTGKQHNDETKSKISDGIKKYFKTPDGKMAAKTLGIKMRNNWDSFKRTDDYQEYRAEMSYIWSKMCKDMHKYNKEN